LGKIQITPEQKLKLERYGFTMEDISRIVLPKRTYYKLAYHFEDDSPYIVTLPNLPSDPDSLTKYLAMGFKLSPSDLIVATPKAESAERTEPAPEPKVHRVSRKKKGGKL
jgi:hypothetical protein